MSTLIFHVWLETMDHVLDFTTYTLPAKAAALDLSDGGETNISWCPDFLFAPKRSISSKRALIDGAAGSYFYERNLEVECLVMAIAKQQDPGLVNVVEMLYLNQSCQVLGPNQIPEMRGS